MGVSYRDLFDALCEYGKVSGRPEYNTLVLALGVKAHEETFDLFKEIARKSKQAVDAEIFIYAENTPMALAEAEIVCDKSLKPDAIVVRSKNIAKVT